MVFSPALANRQRKLAAASGKVTASRSGGKPMPDKGPVATEYQTLLIQLGQDLRRLSDIQSVERKIEAKREMIVRYEPWVQGAVEGDGGSQDEIVVTMLIWAIDTGAWPGVIKVADYVLRHGLTLPERYKRQPATLIAEEVAEAGLANPPTVDLDTLQQISSLTSGHDMHDQVRAKLAKAIGLALKARADTFDAEAESAPAGGKAALLDAALTHFNRALELDPKSGVKKLIEGLERERKKLAEQAG
jgi:hypothetical protein